jgi:hypothetical protein
MTSRSQAANRATDWASSETVGSSSRRIGRPITASRASRAPRLPQRKECRPSTLQGAEVEVVEDRWVEGTSVKIAKSADSL